MGGHGKGACPWDLGKASNQAPARAGHPPTSRNLGIPLSGLDAVNRPPCALLRIYFLCLRTDSHTQDDVGLPPSLPAVSALIESLKASPPIACPSTGPLTSFSKYPLTHISQKGNLIPTPSLHGSTDPRLLANLRTAAPGIRGLRWTGPSS